MTWESSIGDEKKANARIKREDVYVAIDDGKDPVNALGRVYEMLKHIPMEFESDSRLVNVLLPEYIQMYHAEAWEAAKLTIYGSVSLIRQIDAIFYRAVRHIKKDGVIKFPNKTFANKSQSFQNASNTFGNSITIGEKNARNSMS